MDLSELPKSTYYHQEPSFYCMECGSTFPVEQLGEAIKNNKTYKVCKSCCAEEQKKQFYESMQGD